MKGIELQLVDDGSIDRAFEILERCHGAGGGDSLKQGTTCPVSVKQLTFVTLVPTVVEKYWTLLLKRLQMFQWPMSNIAEASLHHSFHYSPVFLFIHFLDSISFLSFNILLASPAVELLSLCWLTHENQYHLSLSLSLSLSLATFISSSSSTSSLSLLPSSFFLLPSLSLSLHDSQDEE